MQKEKEGIAEGETKSDEDKNTEETYFYQSLGHKFKMLRVIYKQNHL
jgi:hypothetical protein